MPQSRLGSPRLKLPEEGPIVRPGPSGHLREAQPPLHSGNSHLYSLIVLCLRESVVHGAKSLTEYLTTGNFLNLAKPQLSYL